MVLGYMTSSGRMNDALRGMVCTDRGTTPNLLGGTEENHQTFRGHYFLEGGKPLQSTAARWSGRAPGPEYIAYVFVCFGSIDICRLGKLTSSDQIQVTLRLTVVPI
jgi:hypothetical protein